MYDTCISHAVSIVVFDVMMVRLHHPGTRQDVAIAGITKFELPHLNHSSSKLTEHGVHSPSKLLIHQTAMAQ